MSANENGSSHPAETFLHEGGVELREGNSFRARTKVARRRLRGRARRFAARRPYARLCRVLLLIGLSLSLILLFLAAALIHHVYFDRTGLPELDAFLRFEPPTTGRVYDAQGKVLIELAGEYREVVSYDEVPVILRQAILAAFRRGLNLVTMVPDEPIEVAEGGADGKMKWIANYDNLFKGPIPIRQALAESRNAVAVWIAREIGLEEVIRTAHELGIHTPLQPYITTALGASEVRLLELAGVYRAMASGVLAEPHVIDRVLGPSGVVVYEAPTSRAKIDRAGLSLIQEGLRGVVRLPDGTAHSLDSRDFPIPVMGKTGTTSDFRDALFVGSTYGSTGITVAVRIGFDDNRTLGAKETGGLTALPIFREIMLRVYREQIVGPAPRFPREIEEGIDGYLANQIVLETFGEDSAPRLPTPLASPLTPLPRR